MYVYHGAGFRVRKVTGNATARCYVTAEPGQDRTSKTVASRLEIWPRKCN